MLSIGLGLLVCFQPGSIQPAIQIRGFGLIAALAYSAYLTHKEIIHLVRIHLPRLVESRGWLALLAYFAFSFLCAFVLYLAIERPFLRLRERISSRRAKSGPTGRCQLGKDLCFRLCGSMLYAHLPLLSSCKIYL